MGNLYKLVAESQKRIDPGAGDETETVASRPAADSACSRYWHL